MKIPLLNQKKIKFPWITKLKNFDEWFLSLHFPVSLVFPFVWNIYTTSMNSSLGFLLAKKAFTLTLKISFHF